MRAALGALLVVMLAGSLSACQSTPAAEDSSVLNSMRSTKDQQRQVYACLKDAGWDVTFDEDSGAIISDAPDAQDDAFGAALDKCNNKLGLTFNTPPNEEQLRAVYRWYKEVASCLKRNNWQTPTPPSFATFSDTYDSDPWIPWIAVPGSEMSSVAQKCPVMAEGSDLTK
jgi:hypothetical protein